MEPIQPSQQSLPVLPSRFTKKRKITAIVFLCLIVFILAAGSWFMHELSPAGAKDSATTVFEIKQGEGFREVAGNLMSENLIRSSSAFDILALLGGHALTLKPGLYRLNASMTTAEIVKIVSGGSAGQVTVTIPEGSNIFEIDSILSTALVIRSGDLIRLQAGDTYGNLEGKLFPDTYEFYTSADPKNVVQELLDNFNIKAQPLLAADGKNIARDLIIASILEKEVPGQADREIVASIILKRIAAKMTINVDATVCYAKLLAANGALAHCSTLTALDFKIKSPYNSYLYGGLPPGPIGNPGVSAITAAMHPQSSPYWYYLSDPKTGKTVFAKTLDEQTQNRVKYLERE